MLGIEFAYLVRIILQWPQYTPTLHALITEYLEIPMDCYDFSEVPCEKFNIVNEDGKKAGFATFVEKMASMLIDAGACYYPLHQLTSIMPKEDGEVETTLKFANGVTATATKTTILNIPQRPLLAILRNSDMGMLSPSTVDALHSVQTEMVSKLYLYYPRGQVFWRKLGLETGDFERDGNARTMLLQGRYHGMYIYSYHIQSVHAPHRFSLLF